MFPSYLLLVTALCATFTIIDGQLTVIAPSLIEGRAGDTVEFYCDSGSPGGGINNAFLIFDTVDNFFVSFDNATGRLQRNNNGQFSNFTFGPLVASDNGTVFRCETPAGAAGNAVISVVFAAIIARVSPVGNPVTVREGEAITVELNVSANPPPNYQWTRIRNNAQELVMNGDGITVSLDSVAFNPASRQQSGEYTLVANNSAGTTEYTFTFDVQYPPEFPAEIVSPGTFNCSDENGIYICASYPGVTATLFCDAIGNPFPTVERTVSGVSDQSNVDLVTGRDITITSVNSNNAGEYVCTSASAQFPQDTATRTIRLYVGGVAQPLSGVIIMPDNQNFVVSWSYVNSRAVNLVPARYFIITVSQNGMQIGNPFMIDIATTSFTVPETLLVQGQTYMVSVVVRNLQGDSETVFSESFTAPGSALATSMHYMLSFLALVIALLF